MTDAAAAPGMVNGPGGGVVLRATVAYDGSGVHGFAVNRGVRTIAGTLEDALGRILGAQITITCAGRTDKGVHARGQVISFPVVSSTELDLGRVQYSVNRLIGPEVVVRDLEAAPPGFDARFSARWRRYRYRLWNAHAGDPFRRHISWHVPEPLDLDAMGTAGTHLLGEHDFSSFCRRPKPTEGSPTPSMVRNILDVGWTRGCGEDRDLVTFEVRATSFCHQMVRSLVGTLVDVGLGRIDAAELAGILAARDRRAAGRVAPPEGLTLWDVGY